MRVRRAAVAAAVGVLLTSVVGCSGDEAATVTGDEAPTSSSADAPAEERETPDDGEAEPVEQSGGYGPKELLAAMKAAVAKSESAHMAMEISGGGQSMTADGDVSYEGDTTQMQLTMQATELGTGTIELRMLDGVMYMSVPPMTPEGKFLEFDTDDPNSPFGDLGGVTQGDPMQTFAAFDAGLRKVEYVGREDVDGEEMDHYVLTVDGKAAAKAGANPGPVGLPRKLTYDLWLDEADLMRRVQYDMPSGGVTITMSDWGKPVTVKAPAPDAIMPMPGGPTG